MDTSACLHPTAIIDPSATIGADCRVGPYCVIGPGVALGSGNILKSHVVLQGPMTVGDHNTFFPFCSIGDIPQDLKFEGEDTSTRIGNHNIFREYVTVNRGTCGGGGLTSIGAHNLIMAYCHIAHDCHVRNHTVFANAATLAGHVTVYDYAVLGGFSAVTQFNRIGTHAYIGAGSLIRKDVLPYCIGKGHDAFRVQGINAIGLKRRGYDARAIAAIKEIFRVLASQEHTLQQAVEILKSMPPDTPHMSEMLDFCQSARAGIYRQIDG